MTPPAPPSNSVIDTSHSDVIHDVQFDYYGRRVASCSSDRTVKLFAVNADHHAHIADLIGHEGPVWEVAWAHPKFGNVLASCSYDRTVRIWKETAENVWVQAEVFHCHEASVNSISWAPHELGLSLACASSDGSLSILSSRPEGGWDTAKIAQAHPVGVTSVTWAPASSPGSLVGLGGESFQGKEMGNCTPLLASGGCDNTVKVWRLVDGHWKMDCFPPLTKHSDWVRDVAWAPNLGLPKTTIASASQDGTVVIWTQGREGDQWEGSVLHDFKVPVWRLSWSLTGNILAVSDGNNNVTLWKEAIDGEWAQVAAVQ